VGWPPGAGVDGSQGQLSVTVRPAAVAGRFYPADPAALSATVDTLLAAARPTGRRPVALIAPHAGYRYSGAVAGRAYAQLAVRRAEVSRVVVLGPAHLGPLRGMAVPSAAAFGTPLGPVLVDLEARRAALDLPEVIVADRPHTAEHAIETQLPFLLRTLGPGVPVLPVLVGVTDPQAVAGLLCALTGPDVVAVVSTDLSHYLDQARAHRHDRRTAAAVLARDPEAVGPADACGYRPLRGLLRYAADRELSVEQLQLATSADAGADPRRVVGYGAFLLAA
jgi:MEMO1 family protein